MKNLLELTSILIKGLFVICIVGILFTQKERKEIDRTELLAGTLLIAFLFLFPSDDQRVYVLKTLLELCIIFYYIKYKSGKRNNLLILSRSCSILLIYELTNIVCIVISSVVSWSLHITEEGILLLTGCLFKLSVLMLITKNSRWIASHIHISYQTDITAIILYAVIICVKIPFLFTDIQEVRTLKSAIVAMLVSLAGFLAISGYERHKTNREKEKMEADNRRLSAQLHKSKEILPAMVSVLEQITGEKKNKHNHRVHRLLKEVNDLFDCQLKESLADDVLLKSFGSTGLQILDIQLMEYQLEAARANINLDIFIPEPINLLLKEKKINQLKFQRAIGDMVRNAFKAIERTKPEEGEILLIIGCRQEAVLEISILDNGAPFPLKVLHRLGQRGVTEGGTGNGLADVLEFAKGEKASLVLEEDLDGIFTKTLSLQFDGKKRLEILSRRL